MKKKIIIISVIAAAAVIGVLIFMIMTNAAKQKANEIIKDARQEVTETDLSDSSSDDEAAIEEPTETLEPEQIIDAIGEAGDTPGSEWRDFKKLYEAAKSCIGVPYNEDGKTPEEGFNYLSFISWCLKEAGLFDEEITDVDDLIDIAHLATLRNDYVQGNIIVIQGNSGEYIGVLCGGLKMICCAAPGGVQELEITPEMQEDILFFAEMASRQDEYISRFSPEDPYEPYEE